MDLSDSVINHILNLMLFTCGLHSKQMCRRMTVGSQADVTMLPVESSHCTLQGQKSQLYTSCGVDGHCAWVLL